MFAFLFKFNDLLYLYHDETVFYLLVDMGLGKKYQSVALLLFVFYKISCENSANQDVGFQPPAIIYFGSNPILKKFILPPHIKGRFPLNFGASIKDNTLKCDPIFLEDVNLCPDSVGCNAECLESALQQGTHSPPCLIVPMDEDKCTEWNQSYAAYAAGYRTIFIVRGYRQNPLPLKLDFEDAEAWRLAYEMQDMVVISAGYDFYERIHEFMKQPKSSLQIDGSLHILKTKKPRITLTLGSNYNCPGACAAGEWFIKNVTQIFTKWLQEDRVQFSVHFPPGESCYDGIQCHKYNCIRQSRYCAPDPDGAAWNGYSGEDAVMMSIRLSCIWKQGVHQEKTFSFFPFLSAWIDRCKISSNMYDEKCTFEVFERFFRSSDMSDMEWDAVIQTVQFCVGDPDLDATHQTARDDNNIANMMGWVVPGLNINNQLMGTLLTKQNALDSICEAFDDDALPQECLESMLQFNQCAVGQPGHQDCMYRQEGRMRCKDTFTGYQCVCDFERGYTPKDSQNPYDSICVTVSGNSGGGTNGWAIFGILLLVINMVGITMFIITRKSIKQYIENKTKDILKQYVSVNNNSNNNNNKFEQVGLVSTSKEETIPSIQVELPENRITFSERFS